jgi:alanine-alpha-ketoisovalerate/valine-pyruvate aminotransferase
MFFYYVYIQETSQIAVFLKYLTLPLITSQNAFFQEKSQNGYFYLYKNFYGYVLLSGDSIFREGEDKE